MRRLFTSLLVAAVAIGASLTMVSDAAAGRLKATVDLSSQRMYVSIGGKHYYTWKVSTGRKGYRTPTGDYRPGRMYREYYSRKYNMSPMPHSIFFRGGYAIHGTGYIKNLGRTASHGCVRLHPANARKLYNLVRKYGRGNTRIRVRW